MAKSPFFHFKQFSVRQASSAMKVGTDGVLLGALARFDTPPRRLLDIGCGTGLLALMLKQRYPGTEVEAVEIDPGAADDAAWNFAQSPWDIHLVRQDFKAYALESRPAFDAVVCNPPYFVDALKCPDQTRNTARHTDSLSFEALMQGVARLLSANGRLWVVIPPAEAVSLTAEANRAGLYAVRNIQVSAIDGQPPKRCLIAFEREPKTCVDTMLAMESADRSAYTPSYRKAVEPFYLDKYFSQKST